MSWRFVVVPLGLALCLAAAAYAHRAAGVAVPPVAPPRPPASYAVPKHHVFVSTAHGLARALARGRRTIVLADGVYKWGGYLQDGQGSSIYALHPGKAILRMGLDVGGNFSGGGATIRGLAFDVDSPDVTLNGAEIATWGPAGRNLTVADCTFEGNWAAASAVNALQTSGLVLERLVVRHFTENGIRVSDNTVAGYGSPTAHARLIEDITITGVSEKTPGSSNGTAESGLWVGQPVDDGVHRIRVRNVSLTGIETVNNAWNTTFTDLDIHPAGPQAVSGVAFYLEHFSRNLTIDHFRFTGTRVGFNAEWASPGSGGIAAAHNTVIRDGLVDASGWRRGGQTVGVFLDVGTESTTVSNVVFRNMNYAGIVTNEVIGTNHFDGNMFRLPRGVPGISSGHP